MVDFWHEMVFGQSELNWKAQRVIALRFNKFAFDFFDARTEAYKMVDEKVLAFSDAAMKLASGTFPHVVMADLRMVVDQNLERLSA
ncbi:hypothetical protein SAMN06265338_1144 [Rhodoblastus acidophilus]|uniref:Uncharacterized protein n=1 Tax=Rhodoblastus acidophilus TaxID=1074 RepID=A0A212S6J0_RHOAC|nr:hypothetical protein [Rhodoblastus acidophilus]MCW2318393.1 hypothetical protein [Rhodoblastus acidophilus]SNB80863.1 hypothetical protein SAMN06265338_1144 [Rhodoblastus acidophilus]